MAIKENYKKSGKKQMRRDERRKEAIERNKQWASLSSQEKLEILGKRRGSTAKQMVKILDQRS